MARLWRALLCALLFACLAPGALGQQVVISELMVRNKATLQDEGGKAPAWVELLNEGSAPVGLQVSRRGWLQGGLPRLPASLPPMATCTTSPPSFLACALWPATP